MPPDVGRRSHQCQRHQGPAPRPDDLALGVGRGEGENQRTQRDGDAQRPEQVDPSHQGKPRTRSGRCCGHEQREREHTHRGGDPARPRKGDEGNTEGDVAGHRRWRGQGEQASSQCQQPKNSGKRTQVRARVAAGSQRQDGCEHAGEHDVEPEDRPPVGYSEHRGTKQRAENAAELLASADHTQRGPATLGGPQVRNQRKGRRHQRAATDALKHPAKHEHRQLNRDGCDARADHEQAQAVEQDPLARHEVRKPADHRQDHDVAEQEARDDRRGPLQRVDSQTDPGHHVRQCHDHDVRVRRSERHRDRRGRQLGPRAC